MGQNVCGKMEDGVSRRRRGKGGGGGDFVWGVLAEEEMLSIPRMKVLIYWAMVFLEPVLVFLLNSNNPSKLSDSK